jgi:hypothetical protein
LDYISRLYPAFFEDNDDWDQINKSVAEQQQKIIDVFIKKNCGEYVNPCLEFQRNAAELV